MQRGFRVATYALALGPLCWSSLASGQELFQETVSVTLVEVPIEVTLRGKPLTGLTVDNFELVEDGEVRPIVGFETLEFEEKAGRRVDRALDHEG